MIVIDVNVLIGSLFASHPEHQRAGRLLTKAFVDFAPVVIPDVVWSGFARIATGLPQVSDRATWTDVLAFTRALRADPRYAAGVRGLAGEVDTFLELCERVGARRNLVTDAYIAAIAFELDCPVASFDQDFTRFAGLTLVSQ
jgi:toxin-antitoxin system PIN domain toxin